MSQKKGAKHEDHQMELRRGPWTLEEDSLLIHYIARHGEGRWNLLARCSGLKRTGKSCRLRWLNYLKPDVKRGNLTPEEQFLILELHSKWGNRWSRIAQYLPGRTDNEIKNYWRTRVQKQARQLKIDANSSLFRDAVRCYWMPRLLASNNNNNACSSSSSCIQHLNPNNACMAQATTTATLGQPQHLNPFPQEYFDPSSSENYSMEFGGQGASNINVPFDYMHNGYDLDALGLASASISQNMDYSSTSDCNLEEAAAAGGGDWMEGLWSMDELWHGRRPQELSSIIL